jgi:hypothetical protein
MDHYQPLAEMIGFKGINADFVEEMLPNPDNPIYLTDGDEVLVRNGKIEKLKGTGYLNDITSQRGIGSARRVLSLPIFEKYDESKYLLAITPEQVEYLSSATGYGYIGAVDGTDDSIVSHANIADKIVFTLNDDPVVRYWTGITYGELVDKTLIQSRFLMKHKVWLFLVRPLQFIAGAWVERYQDIWASFPGNPVLFDDADRLQITASGAINGCRELENAPIIYFPDSIHRVYLINDTDGFGSEPIAEDEGLLSAKTLTGGRGIHYFMTKRGICGMKLGSVPVPLSWAKFNRIIIDGIDPLYRTKAVAQFFEDTGLLYVAFPPAGTADNGTLLIYDTNENELVGKRTLTALAYSAMGVFEKDLTSVPADARSLYGVGGIPIFGTSDGLVLEEKYTVYQQLNDEYVSSATLPQIFCGDRHKNKRIMQIDLLVEKATSSSISFTVEITATRPGVADVTKTYTIVADGVGGTAVKTYRNTDVDVFGQVFKVVIKDASNGYGFKLHGITLRGYISTLK